MSFRPVVHQCTTMSSVTMRLPVDDHELPWDYQQLVVSWSFTGGSAWKFDNPLILGLVNTKIKLTLYFLDLWMHIVIIFLRLIVWLCLNLWMHLLNIFYSSVFYGCIIRTFQDFMYPFLPFLSFDRILERNEKSLNCYNIFNVLYSLSVKDPTSVG